jgi:class 3 adenylate cyclase
MDRILATKRSHSMLNVVNTGAVLFGLLDIDTRSQVTILGSPVNLQADEAVAEKDQIIISPYVRDLIQSEFELQKFVPKKSIQSYPEIDVIYEVKG